MKSFRTPAILGAVHHATGVRAYRVPLLPHRLREALIKLQEGALKGTKA